MSADRLAIATTIINASLKSARNWFFSLDFSVPRSDVLLLLSLLKSHHTFPIHLLGPRVGVWQKKAGPELVG